MSEGSGERRDSPQLAYMGRSGARRNGVRTPSAARRCSAAPAPGLPAPAPDHVPPPHARHARTAPDSERPRRRVNDYRTDTLLKENESMALRTFDPRSLV